MPSIAWNKNHWPLKLAEYEGIGHWGDHWGNVNGFVKACVEGHVHGTVLEVGPGAGRLTEHLLEAEQLILVDLSKAFLQYCLGRFVDAKPSIICYETAGFELPFLRDCTVDFAISRGVFMHLNRRPFRGYLRELGRLVRPGGRLVLDYWTIDAPERVSCFEYYSPEVVVGWAEAAGFKVVLNKPANTKARVLIGEKAL